MKNTMISEMAREYAAERDRNMKAALKMNDWNEHPIIDFVWVHAVPQKSNPIDFTLAEKGKVIKHGRKAPPVEEMAVPGQRCSIQRVTKPLYDKLRRERPGIFDD